MAHRVETTFKSLVVFNPNFAHEFNPNLLVPVSDIRGMFVLG